MIPRRNVRICTPEEEQALARRARAGDLEARNELVERNMPLVLAMARGQKGNAEDDLIQEGMAGLIHAADKFDPDRGVRFSTYAARWIRRGFQIGREGQQVVRTPRWLTSPNNSRRRTERGVAGVERCRADAATARDVARLSELKGHDDRPFDVPARELPPCEAAEANDDVAALGRTLPCLKDQHRIVLEQRYFHGRTFDEIAAEIGITKQGAHVAHAHALTALRRELQAAGIA